MSVGGKTRFACVEGPEFDGYEVDFDEAMRRQGQYKAEEAAVNEHLVFINDKFEYSLYAPDKTKRWKLKPYNYSEADISFAKMFIDWNIIDKGIQRVDACRAKDGRLLLVELEDLNPYLSLLEVDDKTREIFLTDFISEISHI